MAPGCCFFPSFARAQSAESKHFFSCTVYMTDSTSRGRATEVCWVSMLFEWSGGGTRDRAGHGRRAGECDTASQLSRCPAFTTRAVRGT
jgi:hypothetical protein